MEPMGPPPEYGGAPAAMDPIGPPVGGGPVMNGDDEGGMPCCGIVRKGDDMLGTKAAITPKRYDLRDPRRRY